MKVANSNGYIVYEFEDFRLDAATRLLYHNGEQIDLTPKAVETLIALVESDGKVISKDDLMQKIGRTRSSKNQISPSICTS